MKNNTAKNNFDQWSFFLFGTFVSYFGMQILSVIVIYFISFNRK